MDKHARAAAFAFHSKSVAMDLFASVTKVSHAGTQGRSTFNVYNDTSSTLGSLNITYPYLSHLLDAGLSILFAASGKHHLQCLTKRRSQSMA